MAKIVIIIAVFVIIVTTIFMIHVIPRNHLSDLVIRDILDRVECCARQSDARCHHHVEFLHYIQWVM